MIRRVQLLLMSFLCVLPVAANSAEASLDDLMQSAVEWAEENLDESALNALQGVDGERVRAALDQLQKEFQGDYVLDLAQLKEAVQLALPILEGYEETLPYAVWLRTRLDYFEVAEQLRLKVPPPKTNTNQPAPPLPNPAPSVQREIWVQKIARRPWPEHAKRYVAALKPVFAAERVPPQLVWIAEVESSFDPRARSPVGAVGLFQLMPATARQLGLRTWPADQRLQPEPSARAAAAYLRYLHAQFKDWRLALAAYNAGEGRVRALLKKHKAASYDPIATHLPAETQMYVPKVESVLLRREGISLKQLPAPRPAK